jgi:hypothetical protein
MSTWHGYLDLTARRVSSAEQTTHRYTIEVGRETVVFDTAADAAATLGAMLPDEYAVVDRARFERLREYVAADVAVGDRETNTGPDARGRLIRAMGAIQPGDIDPLP